jgi:hypothetical protein
MTGKEQPQSAEDTAELRTYVEQYQFAEYGIYELIDKWTAFWERTYGEKPDPERTAWARYFFELCRDTLQQLNRRYH